MTKWRKPSLRDFSDYNQWLIVFVNPNISNDRLNIIPADSQHYLRPLLMVHPGGVWPRNFLLCRSAIVHWSELKGYFLEQDEVPACHLRAQVIILYDYLANKCIVLSHTFLNDLFWWGVAEFSWYFLIHATSWLRKYHSLYPPLISWVSIIEWSLFIFTESERRRNSFKQDFVSLYALLSRHASR